MYKTTVTLLCWMVLLSVNAQTTSNALKTRAISDIQSGYELYKQTALSIWDYAELGYKETKSSALLQKLLKENGFEVTAGVAGIPTAFTASYGSGQPVIGILAEFDALPGLSQQAMPEKKPVTGKDAGHGCGHHLFGTASVAAGIEIKKLIEQKVFKGTIRVYGCPAEEGGSGKVYMVREGLFKDVDAVINWHPGDQNEVTMTSALANKSAKFRFYGKAAHAAMAPEKGRSALDAVEAMNYMVNMMREHIPQEARIHYVITNGGKAPNVVPDFAEVYYYVRHPKKDEVKDIFERLTRAANGAAMGTDTKMDFEIIGGTHDLLLNRTLGEVMQQNLQLVGGVSYSPEEIAFGEKIQASLGFKAPPVSSASTVHPLKAVFDAGGGSTDVGDVSYSVPTVGLQSATWIPGTPAHSWQAVACGGTEVGTKGMMVAAKVMALTAIDLYTQQSLIGKANDEFKKAKGDYKYEALLGDRKPALNYRD
ncbi:M20 family metallopeptidase [Sediminibacterium ginsengisoli]|uniref:Aminobenzoyl-glutamate utilization protein B n=1 Tax=Sediminibacterium ginsengisoli TaxID=413434 RepID=A0A1T4MNF7_9BACT|nr:M20 family metallopeptidase [Sediminibacterium ginsengisoli]SJZ68345.1 aminobenzoyl-glutamate utilization protein B [Sediminibacterium ginsengisoli]